MIRIVHKSHIFFYRLGQPLVNAGLLAFEFLEFSGQTLLRLFPACRAPGVILERCYTLIAKSWFLIGITGFATGAAMALQFGHGMTRFGGKLYVPNLVGIAIVRALGPVFASLMVAARSGGGVAAEIGSMKVTQQLDALRALGADPLEKIVAPIVISLIFGLPILTFLADIAGITGGLLVSMSSLGIAPSLYLQKTVDSLQLIDLVMSFSKTTVFGAFIGLISCFVGMRTTAGTAGIGLATTKAIVSANICVLLADLIITKIQWIAHW